MASRGSQLAFGPNVKIGLVCPYDLGLPGGVQRIVLDLARRLIDSGEDVVVVGPGGGEAPSDVPTRLVGRSSPIPGNDSVVPVAVRPAAWNATVASLSECDLVHVHEPMVPLVGWAALRSPTVVATFHADPPTWVRTSYRLLGPVASKPLANASLTAVSPTAAAVIPAAWGSLRLVPNAIDVDSFRPTGDRSPFRVAFLGRDEPRKGLDTLLEAWPAIRAVEPRVELEVMGARRDPLPSVTFHGRTSEAVKREILASSAVFVAPNTRGESFGLIIAEAMAAGCAIVASDLASFRHVAGDSAAYFRPGDSPALARSVSKLIAEPSSAAAMGRSAQERVKRFDWSVVLGQYLEVYRDALA